MQFDTAILKPGDVLLYSGHGLVDLVINLKTWSTTSHVEIAVDHTSSIASRNGIGVGLYAHRSKGLRYVLRPSIPINFNQGMQWFLANANGKPYGWLILLGFLNINVNFSRGLTCSQFAAMFFDNCGAVLFAPKYPREIISPRDNLITPRLGLVWSRDGYRNYGWREMHHENQCKSRVLPDGGHLEVVLWSAES